MGARKLDATRSICQDTNLCHQIVGHTRTPWAHFCSHVKSFMTIDHYLHAGVDAEPVTDEHVEHHVVPPALVKVGQEMTERHLEKKLES